MKCLPSLVLVTALLTPAAGLAFTNNQRVFLSTPVSNWPKHVVSEYMSPAPLTLDPEASVDEAMSLLFNYGVHGAPVVTNDLKLVGMVSTFDFLWEEAFEGSLLPMQGSAENIEKYISAAKKICGKRVEDVMVTELWEVTPKTTMRTAAAIMTEQRIHHLPVVDEEGRLVGILSSGDVMKDLLHIVNYLPVGKDDEADKSTDGKP